MVASPAGLKFPQAGPWPRLRPEPEGLRITRRVCATSRETGEAGRAMNLDDFRLESDGIKEAICEVRFATSEQAEIVLGRLADADPWRLQPKTRLQTADLPSQLRAVDPNLRHLPSFEIRGEGAGGFLRLGPYAISCHEDAPYSGWQIFQPRIAEAVSELISLIPDLTITRIGLRYINALNSPDHGITKPHNLQLSINAGGEEIRDSFLLNFRRCSQSEHVRQVSVATPDYTAGQAQDDFSIVIDVDIFTPDGVQIAPSNAIAWIEDAHHLLKRDFFSLWPPEVLERSREL